MTSSTAAASQRDDRVDRLSKNTGSKREITYNWICQYCGQPFETTVYSQRYCNPTHKKYAYRERKRAKVGTL